MEHDKVFNKNTNLVFSGTTEDTVKWLLVNNHDEMYIRVGSTMELMSPSEYLAVYV